MTEDQMAQLEELYNEYSYIKERGDKDGGADLRDRARVEPHGVE